MPNKLHRYEVSSDIHDNGYFQLWFRCPGCRCAHGFTVGSGLSATKYWTWNGSYDKPTFNPSLLCNKDIPEFRCHSFVRDGMIQFLDDCWHSLKGQTVEIPDWE